MHQVDELSQEERDELIHCYRQMFLIRRFEEEAARSYAQDKIGGFLHLYIGQEAVAVGGARALMQDDYVLTTYRDHGHALARGMRAEAGMAELYGRDTGCSRGMGGSMHFFDIEHHFLGGHGIVGGHVALAAGVAFKCVYKRDKRVVVCYLGDGATNIGGFHEGISLAGLWKLPVVFVVENNEYAMGTPNDRTLPCRDITKKAEGYAAYRDRFAGDDVRVMRDRLKLAVDHARSGQGPALLEVSTYRFRGHSMSDPGKYRTPEEVELRKQRDPLRITQAQLLAAGVKADTFEQIEVQVNAEVEAAVRFAEQSAPASEALMRNSVYASQLQGASRA